MDHEPNKIHCIEKHTAECLHRMSTAIRYKFQINRVLGCGGIQCHLRMCGRRIKEILFV